VAFILADNILQWVDIQSARESITSRERKGEVAVSRGGGSTKVLADPLLRDVRFGEWPVLKPQGFDAPASAGEMLD
jgi:hypothetical protein